MPLSALSRSAASTSERIAPDSTAAASSIVDRAANPPVAVGEQLGVLADHGLQGHRHAALGGDVLDEPLHPRLERLVGVLGWRAGRRPRRRAARPGGGRPPPSGVAGGEVAVERADPDAGLAGDVLERGVDAVLGERGDGDGRAASRGCAGRRPAAGARPAWWTPSASWQDTVHQRNSTFGTDCVRTHLQNGGSLHIVPEGPSASPTIPPLERTRDCLYLLAAPASHCGPATPGSCSP